MQHFALATALVVLVPFVAATINTPAGVKECEPSQIQFDGPTPYYLSIIPGGQASAPPYKSFPQQSTNTFVWKCDIPAGTSITFALKDGTGAMSYSDKITVGAGTDKSCMDGSSTASAPASQGSNTGPINASPASASAPPAAAASQVSSDSHSSGTIIAGQASTRAAVQAVTTSSGVSSAASATHIATSGAKSQFSIAKSGLTGLMALAGAALF